MTKEDVVLNAITSNRFLGKSPLKFDVYFRAESYLKEAPNIEIAIFRILKLCEEGATYNIYNKYQCRPGANRSTCDIWRIYKNYLGDVDIFTIMRALYKVVNDDSFRVGTFVCPTIRKRVFPYIRGYINNTADVGELGVPFNLWYDIGLTDGN